MQKYDEEALEKQVYEGMNETLIKNTRLLQTIRLSNNKNASMSHHIIGYRLNDDEMEKGRNNTIIQASVALGLNYANKIDTEIAEKFTDLTGGTVGTAGQSLTWDMIHEASELIWGKDIDSHVFCVLHPLQWDDLVNSATSAGASITNTSNLYGVIQGAWFHNASFANTTFVVTPTVAIDKDNNAIGAMYVYTAIWVVMQQWLSVESQRDPKCRAIMLYTNMRYGALMANPQLGIKIISDATFPEQD